MLGFEADELLRALAQEWFPHFEIIVPSENFTGFWSDMLLPTRWDLVASMEGVHEQVMMALKALVCYI